MKLKRTRKWKVVSVRRKLRKLIRFTSTMRNNKASVQLLFMALVVVIGMGVYTSIMTSRVDPTVYKPLLNTIARGESNGNYNAHFGNPGNQSIRFTEMSVAEVLQWQQNYVDQGSPSSAVGKYQIIRPTLAGLVDEQNIDLDARFDAQLQDKLAVALLERRGAEAYTKNKLSKEEFAANLAKEWAALPRITGPNPEQSYYAKDGINRSNLSIAEIYQALAMIRG